LRAQIRGYRQAKRNAEDGISMVQVAEGSLNEVSNMIIRLRELAVQAASDTVGEVERKFSDLEFQSLKEEISRIAHSTEFNSKKLLDGTGGYMELQIGVRNNPMQDRIAFDTSEINATVEAMGISAESIGTKQGAQTSLAAMDNALLHINGARAKLGAIQNRLLSTSNNLEITDENYSAANSRIRDADIAQESADLAKNNVLSQSGISVLAQANQQTASALKLLS
jgi:flagellin